MNQPGLFGAVDHLEIGPGLTEDSLYQEGPVAGFTNGTGRYSAEG
jgi:hypothetical protein